MKLRSLFLILLLGWNTVDDLCVASFVKTSVVAPTSDEDVHFGSLLRRAELLFRIVTPPTLAAWTTPLLQQMCGTQGFLTVAFSPSRAGSELRYLLMSLQR